ncbi:hypothetical protein JHK85_017097 [Glycine max]|nr:hypothetical protein JHK85_017097 [Glycine max]
MGMEVVIDTRKSPSLKDSKNPSDWDNLQVMLHIVVGWNGKKRWVEKNKGMAKSEDGKWVLDLLDEEDVPMPQEIEEISLTLRLCLLYGRGREIMLV